MSVFRERNFFILFDVQLSDYNLSFQLLISAVRLGHHHLAELVEVHRAGAVFVQLLDDSLQLLVGERSQELPDESPESLGGDEALTLLVVDPEGVLQLFLHGLNVGVLNKEGGAELAELRELNLAGAVLVDLIDEVDQLLLGWPEAHGPHDLAELISGEIVLLLRVEQVEADLEDGSEF